MARLGGLGSRRSRSYLASASMYLITPPTPLPRPHLQHQKASKREAIDLSHQLMCRDELVAHLRGELSQLEADLKRQAGTIPTSFGLLYYGLPNLLSTSPKPVGIIWQMAIGCPDGFKMALKCNPQTDPKLQQTTQSDSNVTPNLPPIDPNVAPR